MRLNLSEKKENLIDTEISSSSSSSDDTEIYVRKLNWNQIEGKKENLGDTEINTLK